MGNKKGYETPNWLPVAYHSVTIMVETRRLRSANFGFLMLVALKETDAANRSNTVVADIMDNNTGALGMENETIGGKSGEV
jgi:hypothetical protein